VEKNERQRTAAIALVALWLAVTFVATGCSGNADAQESERADGASTPAASDTDGAAGQDSSDTKAEAEGDDEKADKDKEEAVPVDFAVLGRGQIESVLRYSANLEAENAVEVHAQAARLVTAIAVEEGDRIRRGQVLARLQDDEQRSELAKVRAELDKARREYEREKRLHAESLISEQQFNDATYNLEQLELRLADAERELSYTEVRSPIDGTVTRRLIRRGDPVTIGQHLFDVVDFDSLVARVYVPEKHLRDLRAGIVARIAAPSLARDDYRGSVDRVAPVVDPKTGTVKVTVDVGAQPGLRPGLYVDVDLVTAVHADTLLVPKRALVYDNDQMFVFRVNGDDRAERVRVIPVLTDRTWVETAEGLVEGDRIVVAGQTGLKPDTLLAPREEGVAPAGGALAREEPTSDADAPKRGDA